MGGEGNAYELREEITDTTIRNISRQRVECKCPSHGIGQCFDELVPLEMFVADTLLVHSHSGDGKNAVFGG